MRCLHYHKLANMIKAKPWTVFLFPVCGVPTICWCSWYSRVEKVQLFNGRKVGREFMGFSSCPHLEQSCFVWMALALAEEKKLQPQEMYVTLTRSTERRNKWMEVWDLVLACISRASVLTLKCDGPAPTAAPSLLVLKILLDPGFWDCPLRW